MRAAAADLGINEVVFCPRKTAWFKGSVERFFRTQNDGVIHSQPGTTKSNPQKKAGYDSKAHACLTLETLKYRNRPVSLSITHIFCCQLVADGDVGEARQAAPEYRVTGRTVGCAIQVAAETGELQQRRLQ